MTEEETNEMDFKNEEFKIIDDDGTDGDKQEKSKTALTADNIKEIVADFEFRASCVKDAIISNCADIDRTIVVKFTGDHVKGRLVGVSIGHNPHLKMIEVGIPLEVLSNIEIAKSVCLSIVDSIHKIERGETP